MRLRDIVGDERGGSRSLYLGGGKKKKKLSCELEVRRGGDDWVLADYSFTVRRLRELMRPNFCCEIVPTSQCAGLQELIS